MPGRRAVAKAGGDRHRQLRGVLDVDLEVVLEVLAHARQVVHDRHAVLGEQGLVADAGELEQLGRVDRAAAEDHLAGLDTAVAAAGARVVDADGAGAVEADLGGERGGLDVEVLPVAHRVQVGPGRGPAAAAVDVAVEPREALLPVAVDVVGQRVAGLLRGLEEGAEQRVRRRPALDPERPAAAAPVVGADSAVLEDQALHALEVGQAVEVVPGLHARVGGPALVVHRVAPLEDHPVDAARAAEDLAAGVEHLAAVHVRLGVGLVLPVVEPVADRDRQRRGHVDERVDDVVGAAGLEDQHRARRVGAEPVGDGAAGGPAADDHVVVALARVATGVELVGTGVELVATGVELVETHGANQCWGAGLMLCQTCLVSRYSSRPARPSSRPMPDCL